VAQNEDRLVNIEKQLSVVIEKLNMFISASNDHETRIRSLEKNLWVAVGGGAVVIVLGGVARDYVMKLL
jgi:hypothetical protein